MSDHAETVYEDTCAWCKHDLKVYVLSWQTCKCTHSMPILANYCDEKACKDENCNKGCGEIALSTPEGIEKVFHEIWRRRKKLTKPEAPVGRRPVPTGRE